MRYRSFLIPVFSALAFSVAACTAATVGGVDPIDDVPERDAAAPNHKLPPLADAGSSSSGDPGPDPGPGPVPQPNPSPDAGTDSGSNPPPPPPDAGNSVDCPEAATGGGVFDNHCYFAITPIMTQPDAVTACVNAGAHLVTITTSSEDDFVNTIGTGDRWIGLTQPGTLKDKTAFSWIDGETPVPDLWKVGQPDGSGCAVLNVNGEFEDRYCTTNSYAALCERE